MPMDGLTVGFAARELNETLKGGRIDRINQPEKDLLLLGSSTARELEKHRKAL